MGNQIKYPYFLIKLFFFSVGCSAVRRFYIPKDERIFFRSLLYTSCKLKLDFIPGLFNRVFSFILVAWYIQDCDENWSGVC